jgi:hypothetical protein
MTMQNHKDRVWNNVYSAGVHLPTRLIDYTEKGGDWRTENKTGSSSDSSRLVGVVRGAIINQVRLKIPTQQKEKDIKLWHQSKDGNVS